MDYKAKYDKLQKDIRTYFEQRTKLMTDGSKMPKAQFEKLFRDHQTLDEKLRKESGANSKNSKVA